MKRLFTLYGILLSLTAALFSACSDDNGALPTPTQNNYIYADIQLTAANPTTTRADIQSDDEETSVKKDGLHILVFKTTDNGSTESFVYEAEVMSVSSANVVSAKIQKSTGTTDKYSLVVIANTDISALSSKMTDKSLTRADIATLTFTNPNDDNDPSTNPDTSGSDTYQTNGIPMWGQILATNAVTVVDGTAFSVNIYRAVARMDVGFSYDSNSKTFSASSQGYSLKTVHVYRDTDKGYIVPALNGSGVVQTEQTNVPSDVDLQHLGSPSDANTDQGAVYTPTDANHSVYQIYVPENALRGTDNATTLVVGLQKSGSSTIGYYRMSIQDASKNILPIIRNHRYICSILSVTGDGYPDPETALNAVDTQITYAIVAWNEETEGAWISGNYYFKVNYQSISIPSFVGGTVSNNKLSWETNLPLTKIHYGWATDDSSGTDDADERIEITNQQIDQNPSSANGNVVNGSLVFAPKKQNDTGADINYRYQFQLGEPFGDASSNPTGIPLLANVVIHQDAFGLPYYIQRGDVGSNKDRKDDDIQIYGSLRPNVAPSVDKNYIEMTMHFKSDTEAQALIGATWHVWATSEDGLLTFDGTGTFNGSTKQIVTLRVTSSVGLTSGVKVMKYYSNSTYNDTDYDMMGAIDANDPHLFAEEDWTNIMIGFKSMKIDAVGGNYPTGYSLSSAGNPSASATGANGSQSLWFLMGPNTGYAPGYTTEPFQYTFTSNGNFSTTGNTTEPSVVVQGITLTHYYNGNTTSMNTLRADLAGSTPPDILLVGYNTIIDNIGVQNLADYADRGGVVLFFGSETLTISQLNNIVHRVNENGVLQNVIASYRPDGVIPNLQSINPMTNADNPIITGVITDDSGDIVATSPFGDCHGLSWGWDADDGGYCVFADGQKDLEALSVTIGNANYVSMWMHRTKNLLWIGDGGFICGWYSKSATTAGGVGSEGRNDTAYPYLLDSNYRPKTNTNYRKSYNYGQPVDNSKIFANIMWWAMYQADNYGINTGGLSGQ
jgi:hypothetical protein